MKVAFDTLRTNVGYAHDTIRVSRFASLERVATYFEWSFGNVCPIFASTILNERNFVPFY